MPALSCQQDINASSWVYSGPVNAAMVYSLRPIYLPWSTGAPDTQPRHTPALVLPGLANTVDLTAGPWLIIAVQGKASNCYLVSESQELALDSILAAVSGTPLYLIVRRHFRLHSVDWEA